GKRLAQRRLTLEVSAEAKKWLAEHGFDPLYGARPLRRLIQQAIGDQLAKLLLAGEVYDGQAVPADVRAGGDSLGLGWARAGDTPAEQTQKSPKAAGLGDFCVCSAGNGGTGFGGDSRSPDESTKLAPTEKCRFYS